ncbi:hypothetical protein D0T49_11635 [Paludibacter sp. 221]|uniref:FKBP-type peptidyl-prolyl cis-trans isomerase n=1 Tax=Paludibacter sp. 221 TaxID=2302939 RepID=UPI0013D251A0|nr:FKBP-type peptidyl-prolyl cis-trans isomerase [Paludibacter sp. 221]NDV47698.1 hypothetical protein [Paludibacter sp. 221]
MKRTAFGLTTLFFILVFSFTSCKQDRYLDWKYMNVQWFNKQKELKKESSDENYWQRTESGLLYRVLNEGIGTAKPSNKSVVVVSYQEVFMNEKVNSDVTPSTATLSYLSAGLQEGIKMMKLNAIYEFCLPYELAYGEDGTSSVPPYTTLIYHRVELHDFYTQSN